MLNIELPLLLFATLSGVGDFNPLPNFIEYVIPVEGPSPEYRVMLLGYDTCQFLINIGGIITTLLISILTYPLLYSIKQVLGKRRAEGYLYNYILA